MDTETSERESCWATFTGQAGGVRVAFARQHMARSAARFVWKGALASLLVLGGSSAIRSEPPQAPEENPESRAEADLSRAEDKASKGYYEEARAIYKRLAREFPDTKAGATAVRRSAPSAFVGSADVLRHGASKNRVDIVLMGDGYTLDHMEAFAKLAANIPEVFARVEPFREYAEYVNFLRADLVSADNGVDGFGREYDTALDAKTLGTFAGHVGIEHKKAHGMLAEMPAHDGLAIVFVKNGVLGTGGGGVAVIGGQEVTTVVHEFGHAFGGLGDEYESQQSAHQGGVGDRPNVSSSGAVDKVPWAHWLAAKVPGVGVFEGAAARLKGAWKPTQSGCVMSSGERFCVVCREALILSIYARVDPIDSSDPLPQPQRSKVPYRLEGDTREFRVNVLRPATHALEVTWWVLPEARFVKTGSGRSRWDEAGGEPKAERRKRGELQEFTEKPWRVTKNNTTGVHSLALRRTDLEPGVYRIVCRVRDTTRIGGDRFAWVLRDDAGVLQSERAWWFEVPTK